MDDRLLTAAELATRLGVEENTVYRWSREGRIPGLKVGRWWRFRAADVEQSLVGATAGDWRTLVEPLKRALRRGDHLVCYELDPGVAARVERAFVAAGLRSGAVVVHVSWDRAERAPETLLRRAGPVDGGRLAVVDAQAIPLGDVEAALRARARALRRSHPGASGLWIWGAPPRMPSADSRLAKLEAALARLAPREGWVVLCLYPRVALRERDHLAALHGGELAPGRDGAHVLAPRG